MPVIVLLFLALLAWMALGIGFIAKISSLETSLAACRLERPAPPPPKCRFTEGDMREALAGWENCTDIATTCIIDLDLCKQTLETK